MSRESKIFTSRNKLDIANQIKDYESFGWELLSVNDLDVSMSRNTQIPVYVQLVKYENEYEELMERIRLEETKLKNLKYTPMSLKMTIILFVLLIFPAVLYFLYKKKQKEQYISEKEIIEKNIFELEMKVKKITNDSRATFYAKRD